MEKRERQMKNKHFVIFAVTTLLVLSLANATISNSQNVAASEKSLVIKGLYIGMDIHEARKIMESLLGHDWNISPIGETKKVLQDYRFGDEEIFGALGPSYLTASITGDRGFAIYNKSDYYCGYISTDKTNDKVTRISFSGRLTDYIFSTKAVDSHDFVKAFWTHYNMPEFNWIIAGWIYSSPKGYTIKIKTSKFIDIKKDEDKKEDPNKFKIQFD
jgi:hypothetical protein